MSRVVNWVLFPLSFRTSRLAMRLGGCAYERYDEASFDYSGAVLLWIDEDLPTLFLPNADARHVVLYLHGNGADVRMALEKLEEAREAFGAHVLACEYPGYGLARGNSNEATVNQAVRQLYDFATSTLNVPPERIVVLGRSIGTGPAVNLAKAAPIPPCMLVLISPYASIRSVAQTKFRRVSRFIAQRFNSESIIGDVACPVFIAHGTRDFVLPHSESQVLARRCTSRFLYKLYPGRGHNNLPTEAAFEAAANFFNSLGSNDETTVSADNDRVYMGCDEGPVLQIAVPDHVARRNRPRPPRLSKMQRLRRWSQRGKTNSAAEQLQLGEGVVLVVGEVPRG